MSEPYVTVILPGQPVGKARQRFRIVKPKNKPMFIAPYPVEDSPSYIYEKRLKDAAKEAMAGLRVLVDEPVSIDIDARVQVPESWSRRARAEALAGDLSPISKPDVDNVTKIVLDAFNEVVWNDDARVIKSVFLKQYSATPGLIIRVWRWL